MSIYDFEHPPIIELYSIDLTILGSSIYYFHPYETDESVVFSGQTYLPMSIDADGFELSNKGLPTPKITVSNIFGSMSELINNYDGLQGGTLTRTKIQSHAPPHSYNSNDIIGIPDIYVVDRFTNESRLTVTFELRSIFDLSSLKLPRRTIFQTRCPFVYKSPDCDYSGSLATCNHTVDDCLIHFQQMTGQTSPNLSFGGFAGVDRYPN